MKRKINVNRQEISADEINQRKNFDSVLSQHINVNGKPLFKKSWFLSSIAVVTVGIIASVILINNNKTFDNQQLSINTEQTTKNADSLALAEFYAKEEAKPCINPPLTGINIPYTTYKINVQKGGVLNHETGSVLTIPKNAFADKNGKLLKGDVEIRYREFHDPVDFLVSGIPMTYDSGGTRYHFESAGMMEILAFQNGEKVDMMPNKTINVELVSKDDSPKYNLYKLDTLKNNWSCIGKDKVVKKSENSKEQSLTKDDGLAKAKPELVKIENKKIELKEEKQEKIAALPKLPVEPKKPEQAKKGNYTFDLDVDAKEFPELALYKGALFEVSADDKSFNKSLYEITWEDAKLKKGSSTKDSYIMSLKKGTKQYNFVVSPVFEGKNYEIAMKGFEEKFKQYNITLEKRTKEEKRIEEEYNAKLSKLKKEQDDFIAELKRQEEAREKNMSTEQKVFRTFNVNGFGVFNCDNPMKYPKGVITNAELLNDKKNKLYCYDVFLIDKKLNGMYTYYRNPVTKFTYNPESKNILWTIESGVLYYLKPEDFKNFNTANGMQQIKMLPMPSDIKTPEQIKFFFEI